MCCHGAGRVVCLSFFSFFFLPVLLKRKRRSPLLFWLKLNNVLLLLSSMVCHHPLRHILCFRSMSRIMVYEHKGACAQPKKKRLKTQPRASTPPCCLSQPNNTKVSVWKYCLPSQLSCISRSSWWNTTDEGHVAHCGIRQVYVT